MTETKLTVLQVLPALQSGGVERGTLEVNEHLVKHGHRSMVMSAGGRMVKDLTDAGGEHHCWQIGKKSLLSLRLIPKLRRFLMQNQVDILHVRSRFPAWICYLAWKTLPVATRPKLITTVHGPYSINAYSAIMTKAEHVIVISKMIQQYVCNHYHINPDKLMLNYRGIDSKQLPYGYQPTAHWLDTWYQDFPQTLGKRLLLLPARITRWKGQLDFIEMLARVRQYYPDVHGLIVGETKKGKTAYLKELMDKADKLGVSDCLSFTGHRSDIREVMAISTIVYSLSLEPEAFGRTTLEALSLGKPVMAYAHGGVDEQLSAILPEGRIKPGDIDQAAALSCQWLALAPQVPSSHPFSLETMLNNTLKLYQMAVKPRSAI